MRERTSMDKAFDAAFTPTSCVYEERCELVKKARSAALEEAASVCDAIDAGRFISGAVWHNDAASCAAAIRALKEAR